MKNLPMDLLRAFVTVVEFNSFTKAGDLLGRSQPAVSLQINRLEGLLDETLIIKEGKNLVLSDAVKPSMNMQSRYYLLMTLRSVNIQRALLWVRYGWAFLVNLPQFCCQR